jgi:hypothetical protein
MTQPTDITYRARLADAIREGAAAATGRIRVCVDAEIVSYDSSTTTAKVRPCVRELVRVVDGLVYADALEISNVPVRWPGDGSGVAITWPLPVGAIVPLVIRDRSHDEVDDGAVVPSEPVSQRRWDLADAEVLPLAWSARDPLPSSASSSTCPVVLLPAGQKLLVGEATAARALALATETAAKLAAIETVINTLTLPVSGATAGPPVPVPFVTTTTATDIQTLRIQVDTQ